MFRLLDKALPTNTSPLQTFGLRTVPISCHMNKLRFRYWPRVASLAVLIFSFFLPSLCKGRPPKNVTEAKECMLFVSTFDSWKRPLADGTAFVVEDAGKQWIYTNAHVIEGATKIEFTDSTGVKIKSLGKFQCLTGESGSGKVLGCAIGGDGIRIELKRKRELAFVTSKKLASSDEDSGEAIKNIITIGDNDGDKVMDVMEGQIKAASRTVAISTCKTRPGCSGGVIIDPVTFEAIGLHTWGFQVDGPKDKELQIQNIWKEGKLAGCSLMQNFMWIEMSAADFLKGTVIMKEFQETVRILFFIYGLVPSSNGFEDYNYAAEVGGSEFTALEIMKRYENHRILKAIVNVNRKVANKSFTVNVMDLVRAYAKGLASVRELYVEQKAQLEKNIAPYFKVGAVPSAYFRIGDALYEGLEPAEDWFVEKASVGGKMPLGKWYNNKPLASFK